MTEQIYIGTAVLELEDKPSEVIIQLTTILAKNHASAERKLLRMAGEEKNPIGPAAQDEFDNSIKLLIRPF